MSHDKFDFNAASQLVQVVDYAAQTIDVKNGQIEKKFGKLHEFFKDNRYDEFESEMSAVNNSIEQIVTQLHEIGRHIAEYSERLKGEY